MSMDIKTHFALLNKLSFYQTPRFYQDTNGKNNKKSRGEKGQSKKQTVFDEIIKAHSKIPGPGKYSINPEQTVQQKKQLMKKQGELNPKPRQNFLDPILKRSMSLPSVGQYNIMAKIKKSPQKETKKAQNFRSTIFDNINQDMIGTSPGIYEINKQTLPRSPRYSISPEHTRKISLPKIPSPGDYDPIPSSYSTFEKQSKMTSSQYEGLKNTTFGARTQEKMKDKSPGPYNLITDWGKKVLFKIQFNIYKTISAPKKQRIYANPHKGK